jgi:acetyl-CoA C-acetyltransferase
MINTYIIDAKRTAIGKFGGSLFKYSATDLGTIVLNKLLEPFLKLKNRIDEVIIGNSLQAGLGQNPARIIAYKSRLKNKIPSYTVNKVCGSGLKSIILGFQSIKCNEANLIIAGGIESMSNVPYYLDNYRYGVKFNNQTIRDGMIYDGLICNLIRENMGVTAENISKKYKISRYRQDEYAYYSHKKAIKSSLAGVFSDEIVPIVELTSDEQPRSDTSIEKLSKLKSIFIKNGTVTAGNSSSINDGAAIALLASENFIKRNNLKPLAIIRNYSQIGCDPQYMGLGAYHAIENLLKKTNINKEDINLWEINEAFASQALAVIDKLDIDQKKINTHGGAIALGHPIGASGTRILTTLLYALKRKKKKYGVASLCIGGGQGIAVLIENL